LNVLFLNNMIFAYFCLQASELNDVLNFVSFPPDILTGKNMGSLSILAYKIFSIILR
jgi:hypothetical protein